MIKKTFWELQAENFIKSRYKFGSLRPRTNDRFSRLLRSIKQRCLDESHSSYKWYGGRQIGFLLTEEDLIRLWFRDKGWLLKDPTIDRIDNDGHYTYRNCQFIERVLNSQKDKYKPLLQFGLNNKFIKEYLSIIEASKSTKIPSSTLSQALYKTPPIAGGFIWRFKNTDKPLVVDNKLFNS